MSSVAQVLHSLEVATDANRWTIVGDLGKIRRRKDTGTYFLDFRRYGRLYRHRGIPISDEGTAQRLLEQIRGTIADGRSLADVLASYMPARANPNRVLTRLEAWLKVKRREVEAGDRSPTYLRELERYARPDGYFSWWAGRSIHEIDYAALEDWSLWMADERGLAPKTRANALGALRSFVSWLHRREELRRVPEFSWPKGPEYQPRILSAEAQGELLHAIPEDARGIFLAMALMGIRPGEARALLVSDFSDGWLSVDKAVKGNRIDSPVRGTKSGKPKRLPTPDLLIDWIEHFVAKDARLRREALFVNPNTGGPWTPTSLRRCWEKACKALRIEGISIYEGCKHSFATDAVARGVQERHLQAYLGHADARSTRRYARLADAGLINVLPQTNRARDLSRTCPTHNSASSKHSNSNDKMVEAAGIEPASA